MSFRTKNESHFSSGGSKFYHFLKRLLVLHVLTSKIILCSPKQKVEPKGLVLLADEDLSNTTHTHMQKVARTNAAPLTTNESPRIAKVCGRVLPVEHYRLFHRVAKQLLNLIPLQEKETNDSC